MKKFILLLMLLPFLGFGQTTTSIGYLNTTDWSLTSAQGMSRKFSTYGVEGILATYKPTTMEARAVIMSFHGIGEEGNTLEDFLGPNGPEKNEIPKLFKNGKEVPYIVLVPMLRKESKSWPTNLLNNMLDILDVYKSQGYDIHITGLSLGGIAVHAMAKEAYRRNGYRPGYFKSIGAVCGRINAPLAIWYDSTNVKLWHGTLDPTLPFKTASDLYTLLSKQYNIIDYPDSLQRIQKVWYVGSGHAIWAKAYDFSKDSYWHWLDGMYLKPNDTYEVIHNFILKNGNELMLTVPSGTYYIEGVELKHTN